MFALNSAQKLALAAARPRLEARRLLERHGPKMAADELYDWVLRATGSEAQAERAAQEKLRAQLRGGGQVG